MPCSAGELEERLHDVQRLLDLVCVTPFKITAVMPAPAIRVDCIMPVSDEPADIQLGLKTAQALLQCVENRFRGFEVKGFIQVADLRGAGMFDEPPPAEHYLPEKLHVQLALFVIPPGTRLSPEYQDVHEYLEQMDRHLHDPPRQEAKPEEGAEEER